MSLIPQLLTKNLGSSSPTQSALFSAPSSASSLRRKTQQNLSLATATCSSGSYVPKDLNAGNATPPFGAAISVSRRSSTVDDCGRFCALPQSNGTLEARSYNLRFFLIYKANFSY